MGHWTPLSAFSLNFWPFGLGPPMKNPGMALDDDDDGWDGPWVMMMMMVAIALAVAVVDMIAITCN